MSHLLEIQHLSVFYGAIQALNQINLHVNALEKVCLIGANGAGKTTLMKSIMGLLPKNGHVLYQNEALHFNQTHLLSPKGLHLVPEGRGVFPLLTVEENLKMGGYHQTNMSILTEDLESAYQRFPRLKERRTQMAGTLSGGEQQMLAIARALMSRPKLLLLDEPSMGLAPLMVEKIFQTLDGVAKEGVTLLLVEQNAHQALQLCDRAYVMESGQIIREDNAKSLLGDDSIRSAYLGDIH